MVHDRESSASIRGRQKSDLAIEAAKETGVYSDNIPEPKKKKSKAQILRDLYK